MPHKDAERRLTYQREYQRRWMREYRANNPNENRDRQLRCKYGIDGTQAQAILDSQGGLCPICHETVSFNGKSIGAGIDHCHATGKVRAVLCLKCNFLVGWIEKIDAGTPDIIKAREYLTAFGVE